MGEGCGNLGAATVDGRVFTTYFLRRVVRIQSPTVLASELLSSALTHDLRTGLGLTLGHTVTVANVEDQAGWLAHWLDTNEVIGDQLWKALAKKRQCKAGEVGDVGRGGLVFGQERRTLGWVAVVVLVFKQCSHEAELFTL